MSSTVQEVQTTQPTASAESTRPKPTPIETKTPPAFEENSVKVTLADYDEKNVSTYGILLLPLFIVFF